MSKVDAQRAMRDARYAAYEARRKSAGDPVTPPPAAAPRPSAARAAASPSSPSATSAPSAVAPDAAVEPEAVAVPENAAPEQEAVQGLCGHRSIGNKSCTRPAGHPEKSHRYS